MILIFIATWSILAYVVNRLVSGTMTTQQSRRVRPNEADRISCLPDSVMCHIMSCLDTKDAARTSVLSKDWKDNWTTAYKIDITDLGHNNQMFYDFMDKIVDFPHDLLSFRLLSCGEFTDERFTRWISAAMRRKTGSFEFRQFNANCFVLPIGLLNDSTYLKTLKLTCVLKVPSDSKFSHLTDLHLSDAVILNEQSKESTKLVFSFPALKKIVLIDCKWIHVLTVDIYSPKLLIFSCESKFDVAYNQINIYGASLDKFESYGKFPEKIRLHESTVHTAALRGYPEPVEYGLQARNLMTGFCNLIKLELSSSMCEVLRKSMQALPLPRFNSLLALEMSISNHAQLLFEFLNSAPSLEFVILNGTEDSEVYKYVQMELVPRSVNPHLKVVSFINISKGLLLPLADLIFKNGFGLEKIHIEDNTLPSHVVSKYIERLRMFPKPSAAGVENFPPGFFILG